MRSPYYGQLGSLTHHPDVGVIWRTRDEEPEPCKPCGWSDEYIDDPEERFLMRDFMRRVCQVELSDRQQQVMVARYGDGLTLDEVAEQMGVTRERVRQIEAKALRTLRSRGYLMELKAREDLEWRKSAPSPFLVLSDPCAVTGPNREVLTTGTMEQCLQWMRGRSDCVLVIKD